ncbi:MAG: acylphosphatase [Chitinophagaceae bacterium]|nr:acylphosphatase [Chitinophagaceae bacterium]
MIQTISIIVTGKVQGVFYRQSTKEKALELNITGVVSNLHDGSVKIIASGDADQLHKLAEWCWQGPRRAKVMGVTQETLALQTFDAFTIEK